LNHQDTKDTQKSERKFDLFGFLYTFSLAVLGALGVLVVQTAFIF
jgi:hypothetical protein